MDNRYREIRDAVEKFFVPANYSDRPHELHRSPSQIYELEISFYHTRPSAWGYSRGEVRRVADGTLVADIKRNYDQFWRAWVAHPNGKESLLCGEDYQGYSIVDLQAGVHQRYFPEEGYTGAGFCWVKVDPSPDGLVLAVTGCHWADEDELVFYDLADPERLPFPELARITYVDKTMHWEDNDTFVFQSGYSVRASDGAVLDELDNDEAIRLLNSPGATEHKSEMKRWRRNVLRQNT